MLNALKYNDKNVTIKNANFSTVYIFDNQNFDEISVEFLEEHTY